MQANDPTVATATVSADQIAVPGVVPAAETVRRGRKAGGILEAFRPHGVISPTVFTGLVVAQIALALGLWAVAPTAIPTPGEVGTALIDLLTEQGLVGALYTSLMLNIKAIALMTAISLALAYSMVLPALRPIGAFASALRFTSMVGFTFVFTLMAGGAHTLKLYLLVFGMSVFMIPAMIDIVLDKSPERRERLNHARTLRMGPWRVVWEVVVLGNLHKMMDALRNVAAMGWLMLTMVEGLVRSEGGIGVMLLNQNKHMLLAAVFAIQITVLVVGLTQDYLLGLLKGIVAPHADLSPEKR